MLNCREVNAPIEHAFLAGCLLFQVSRETQPKPVDKRELPLAFCPLSRKPGRGDPPLRRVRKGSRPRSGISRPSHNFPCENELTPACPKRLRAWSCTLDPLSSNQTA